MNAPQNCPKCAAELPGDAPAGLCPKCLVAAGFETDAGGQSDLPKSDPEAPTIDGPAPLGGGFQPPTPRELADRFPQLEILELLGHGGMGAVYKARQSNLDRLVALKIIRPAATHDPAFAERFNREARTLARLSHQNIVAVHDFGEVEYAESERLPTQPLYFFLMEYVEGANLRQLMRSGELTPQQALSIVPQVCEALQYAHDEGVVHRDVKPENILLDKRGRVKIADFGLAKLTTRSEADFTLTGTHQVMGTLRYMAPEQLEASHAVDHRADIYSLGVVFYEMLTGEAPMGHFDPPSKKVQVDVRLDEVVLRSLAREPERRYQHASEVKTDVESISSSSTPPVKPVIRHATLDEAGRTSQRLEVPALFLSIAGVLFCLLGVVLPGLHLTEQIYEDALLVYGMAASLLVVGGVLVVAGWHIRQLRHCGIGVAASLLLLPVSTIVPAVFSQSNSPWMFAPLILLLPVALWLLWLLSRPEVKRAFELHRQSVGRETASSIGGENTAIEAGQSLTRLSNAILVLAGLGITSLPIVTYWLAVDGAERFFGLVGNQTKPPFFILSCLYIALALPQSLLFIVASLTMRNSRFYWLAVMASIVAIVPLSVVWPATLPIGLWALVVLSKPDVHLAFQRAATAVKSPVEQIQGPSRLLVVTGVINLVQAILCVGAYLQNVPPPYQIGLQIIGVFILTPIVLGGLQIVGGLKARSFATFGLVQVAAVLSILPISSGAVLGIPAGIWALVVLSNSEVKRAFALRKRGTLSK
ncbi:MAG: serine/threonine protein kinase [Planctomycetales bacterium]|nr:serine/threonine protein kinase [Planctomycetales bacterium]